MARIKNYVNDKNITNDDLLVGSSFEGNGQSGPIYKTKNFKLSDLAPYFSRNFDFEGVNYDLSLMTASISENELAIATANQSLSVIANDVLAQATFQTNLSATFGTFTDQGVLISLSESFADQVFQTTTSERYANALFVTNLASSVGTFDANGNLLTIADGFANSVMTTTSSDRFAESQFVDNLGASFGTVGTDGTITTFSSEYLNTITAYADSTLAITSSITTLTADVGDNAAAIVNESIARVIATDALASEITTLTATVDTNTAAITTESTTRATEDEALATQITTLSATVDSNTAAITTESTTRATEDEALATQITTLSATVDNNTAAITTESTTRATEDEALATQITTLSATVNTNTAAITTESTTRATEDEALSTQITTLGATVNTNTAAITTEATTRATEDQALSSLITALTATVGGNTSAISTEATARANADTALTNTITTLTATVNNNTAAISTESTARAAADTALTNTITTLEATVDDNTAAISAESTARANADTALTTSIDTLTATVDDNTAAISTESTARADGDEALTNSITTLTATVDGNTASVQTNATAINNVDGKLTASYGITVDAQGRVAGLKLLSNGTTGSEFIAKADIFGVDMPNDTRVLTVDENGLIINGSGTFSGSVTAGLVDITSNNITLGNDGSWGTIAHINFENGDNDIFCRIEASSSSYGDGLRISGTIDETLDSVSITTQALLLLPEDSSSYTALNGSIIGGTYLNRWKSVSFSAQEDISFGLNADGSTGDTFFNMIRSKTTAYRTIGIQSGQYVNIIGGANGGAGSISLNPGTGNYVFITGNLSKPYGSFQIDHPLPEMKDSHHLIHSFVESPQANNIYRGRVTLENGTATINLDTASNMTEGTWVLLNRDPHVYTSNETDWDHVRGTVDGNILTIECQNPNSTATVSWLVIGERHDEYMMQTTATDDNGRVIVEIEKNENNTPHRPEDANENTNNNIP